VVVYDVAPPYEANWQLLSNLRRKGRLAELPIIITTTNERHVRPLAAGEHLHEIIGKPYDLDRLIWLIRDAIAADDEDEMGAADG
jgi:hypothetical protein